MDEPGAVLRSLKGSDIAAAMLLKERAGWNQTEEDWQSFLTLVPEGCFALESGGRVIATSTAVPYGDRFGWVGMVLVDPQVRRRGHGTRVFLAATEGLEHAGVLPALDATPEGREVYRRHGFEGDLLIERRVGEVPGGLGSRANCRPMAPEHLEAIRRLDLESFGADRFRLLEEFLRRAPELALVSVKEGGIDGFILGRRGSDFTHLGPWVARDAGSALDLVETALSKLAGRRVGLDVPAGNRPAREFLETRGFRARRQLFRMVKRPPGAGTVEGGADLPGARPDRVFVIAGPEWG